MTTASILTDLGKYGGFRHGKALNEGEVGGMPREVKFSDDASIHVIQGWLEDDVFFHYLLDCLFENS